MFEPGDLVQANPNNLIWLSKAPCYRFAKGPRISLTITDKGCSDIVLDPPALTC